MTVFGASTRSSGVDQIGIRSRVGHLRPVPLAVAFISRLNSSAVIPRAC